MPAAAVGGPADARARKVAFKSTATLTSKTSMAPQAQSKVCPPDKKKTTAEVCTTKQMEGPLAKKNEKGG